MDPNTLPGFVNPLTGHHVTPGKILGYRRDGRPIRVIAGGSGEGDTGGDGGRDTDGDQDGGNTDGQGDDGSKTPKYEGEVDKARHERALASARDSERKAKERAQASDARLSSVLKALGINPDGKADPEEQVKALTARAEAAEKRATELATRDAVRTAAAKHSGDAELLLDSQRFLGKLADLDPTAADFGDKVADLVKAEVKANPRYAVTAPQGSGKRGADHSGDGGAKPKPKTLEEAIAAKLGG